MDLLVRGPTKRNRLNGAFQVPGDKSIGHRALIFAALARGQSRIIGVSEGEDNAATRKAFEAMGVRYTREGDTWVVDGVGLRGLSMPQEVLDCGNSGTTMRLLAGLLSGQRFGARMSGDESLSGRPMGRIVKPLRARGALIAGSARQGGKEDEVYSPLSIAPLVGEERLLGIEYDMPIASAQVKSAMLLSGLYAAGPTIVREPMLSRDHTERMLIALGVPLETMGSMVAFDPQSPEWKGGFDPFHWLVPGDISAAAFILAASIVLPESEMVVTNVGVNPTRTGFLDYLRLAGVVVQRTPRVPTSADVAGDEPMADLCLVDNDARGTMIAGELLVRMIDEVPIAAVVAAVARGRTEIRDAAELRVKECDRLAAMHEVLTTFGVPNQELPDGLIIEGGREIHAGEVHSRGDHRIAMSAAILALRAKGQSVIHGAESIATSFPNFVELLRSHGADVEVRNSGMSVRSRPVVAIDGPAGAGKSAAATRLADALGFILVNTGALYRAVALCATERNLDLGDGPAVGAMAATLNLSFAPNTHVLIDGKDREDDIRTPAMSEGASLVSQHPEVRDALLGLQRQLGEDGGVVLEGRDIGTVVFPDAEVKVFLTAAASARADRRVKQMARKGVELDYDDTLRAIEERDRRDSERVIAPLKPADDATLLDTTGIDLDEVVRRLVSLVS